MGGEVYAGPSLVDQILVGIANYTFAIQDRLNNLMGGLLAGLSDYASRIQYALGNTLNNVFNSLGGVLNNMVANVTNAFNRILGGIESAIGKLWSGISSLIDGLLDKIVGLVNQAAATLQAFAGTVVQTVTGWIASAYEFLKGLAITAINTIATLASDIGSKVLGLLARAFDDTDKALAQQVSIINSAVQRVFAGTDSILSTLSSRLTQVKEGFTEAATEVVKGVTGIGDEYLKPLVQAIESFVDSYTPGDNGPTLQAMMGALRGTRTDPGQMETFRAFYRDGFEWVNKHGGAFQTAFSFVFLLLTIIPAVMNISGVLAELSTQEWRRNYPTTLLQPGDAAQAVRHGVLSNEAAVDEMRLQGFSEDKAKMIMKLSAMVPPEADLIAMHLRGIIDTPTMDAAFTRRGFDQPWTDHIRAAAQIIPPVQDLIVMAVREVFTPAIAERFGQFEDYPDQLTVYAKQQGLSEEWAKRYWAAHWGLPSAEMGFEMFHRRRPGTRESIITEDELKMLLRALDVMPFWRDRLIDLAYSPYTRVDIRRMHQLGLLTREQVYDAHLDLGYSPEKAENLTEFTIRLNKGTPSDDEQELGKLSRTAVLDFFKDGVISRDKAIALLQGLNYTPEASALYVQSVEMDVQRASRKAEADHLISMATAGTIDFGTAQDKLNALGLTRLEVEAALTKLVRAQESKVKLPTRGEGESFMRAGIITEAQYRDLLSRLGYATQWVNAYVAFAKGKRNAG